MKILGLNFGGNTASETRAVAMPDKVYVDKTSNTLEDYEWSLDEPIATRFYQALNGLYASQNYLELFYCLPEVFAPVHEIASRVADAVWELRKEWNDEVDWKDAEFNRLFSKPNPIQDIKAFVYQAVCYEILTGKQFFYLNRPATLPQEDLSSTLSWWNLKAHKVNIVQNKIDPYSATEINDFVIRYEEPKVNTSGNRVFDAKNVIPLINLTLESGYSDLNKTKAPIAGAEKPIANLLPVYEARGTIYIKRGALGFIVNRAKDQSGATIKLRDDEKKELAKLHNESYGITRGKSPFQYTGANVDWVKTAMSIQELQPFDETLADAVAIYKVLRVPRHLVPSKDNSTFNNADADMRSFYTDVIIPFAKRYADAWTNGFNLKLKRKYIFPSYAHIEYLNDDKKEAADITKVTTETALLQYEKKMITKNQALAVMGLETMGPDGDVYAGDGANKDPLAVQLGVGGMQALQALLADTNMSEEAKKTALVILFGIAEADAVKLVVPKKIEDDNGNSNFNAGGKDSKAPPQAGSN